MLVPVHSTLLHCHVCCAEQGDGSIDDILLVSHPRQLMYLVADTRRWLPGRDVLVPFTFIEGKDWRACSISLRLTKDASERARQVRADPPVSRQLSGKFGYAAVDAPQSVAPTGTSSALAGAPEDQETDRAGRPLLRSLKETRGYHIHALDGQIGHREDCLIDDADWSVPFLELDTRDWLPGRRVLLPSACVDSASWTEHEIRVHVPQDKIRHAPAYDPSAGVTPQFAEKLRQFYQRRN
jgi:hypothetical protein